jgi:esterase/lipase
MLNKPILKAYYGRIFFEFLVQNNPADTILYMPGFPYTGDHDREIQFLYNKGYNVFWPKYPGSYQSKGKFLDRNLVNEFSKFIDSLKKGKVISLWDNSQIKFKIKKLILFGGSFSGAICSGLASKNKIDKMVLFSPLWDFSTHNEKKDEQDLDHLIPFVKRAYKNLFRFEWNSLTNKIKEFPECNPKNYLKKLNLPILVFHDPKDRTVSIRKTLEFEKKLPSMKLVKHNKGHSSRRIMISKWKRIERFLRR